MSIDISIIIPTYQERNLAGLVSQLEREVDENTEVIFSDALEKSDFPKLPSCFTVIRSPRGRARQMNEGARQAKGAILWFLHADTGIPPQALASIRVAMKDARAGSFQLHFDQDDWFFSVLAKCANLRSKWTRIPFGDQAIFIDNGLFKAIGGFSEIPLMEELVLMKKIRSRKEAITILDAFVTTSTRRWQDKGRFKTTALNLALQLAHKCGVSETHLARWYYG